jgi:hypothetical protein
MDVMRIALGPGCDEGDNFARTAVEADAFWKKTSKLIEERTAR